jgi:hypothetical protein
VRLAVRGQPGLSAFEELFEFDGNAAGAFEVGGASAPGAILWGLDGLRAAGGGGTKSASQSSLSKPSVTVLLASAASRITPSSPKESQTMRSLLKTEVG